MYAVTCTLSIVRTFVRRLPSWMPGDCVAVGPSHLQMEVHQGAAAADGGRLVEKLAHRVALVK